MGIREWLFGPGSPPGPNVGVDPAAGVAVRIEDRGGRPTLTAFETGDLATLGRAMGRHRATTALAGRDVLRMALEEGRKPEEFIPFDMDEVSLVLGEGFFVAAKRSSVAAVRDAVRSAGFVPAALTDEVSAIANAVAVSGADMGGCTAVVDIREDRTAFLAFRDDRLLFDRILFTHEDLEPELQLSLDYVEARRKARPTRILLSGDRPLPDLEIPVVRWNPLEKLPSELKDPPGDRGFRAAAALGLAWRTDVLPDFHGGR